MEIILLILIFLNILGIRDEIGSINRKNEAILRHLKGDEDDKSEES